MNIEEAPSASRQLRDYQLVRQRENEALLKLSDTLPRVDGLDPALLEQARDAVFHSDHPFLLTLIGPFGSGKSSLINALLGDAVLPTGPVPTTDRIVILRTGRAVERSTGADGIETLFHPAPLLGQISLVDTPGLESIFTQHSEKTDSFLHRSDMVALVMLATQALSAGNLKYLAELRDYGKRVVIAVNQVDLLQAGQSETVLEFVRDQCQQHLLAEPEIFLVSARKGLMARDQDPVDEAGWQSSGMAALETYITGALDDRERLRQKLQTPLQIARKTLAAAQAEVQTQQSALDHHRAVNENIDAQVTAARTENLKNMDETLNAIGGAFAETATRGEEAIRELFQPARALAQFTGGLSELIGFARLFRRFGRRSQATAAIQAGEVMTPLDKLTKTVNGLGPQLEGRDLQDADDLAAYTQNALDELPDTLRDKMIGDVTGPVSYDREPLRKIRGDLDKIVEEAHTLEPARLDRAVRNTLIVLAGWELAVVLSMCSLGAAALGAQDSGGLLFFALALALMSIGVLLMPVRGLFLARGFSRRLMALAEQYQGIVREATMTQIEYGSRLRYEVASPFRRLVMGQSALLRDLMAELRALDDELAGLAGEVGALWKRRR